MHKAHKLVTKGKAQELTSLDSFSLIFGIYITPAQSDLNTPRSSNHERLASHQFLNHS